MSMPNPGQREERSSVSERQPLRSWELVLLGFGIFVATAYALAFVLSWAIETLWPSDCGLFDFDCAFEPFYKGLLVGGITAAVVTYVVVRWWQGRPPQRFVAWLVSAAFIVTAIVTVLAAGALLG
jgi:hypothetical protein